MNTQNVWIKRSEREPQPDEFPVLAGYYLGGHDKWNEYRCGVGQQLGSATHWRSIKCDPPARELTQRERDATLARNIAMGYEGTVTECVLEGIYAERREVAKIAEATLGDDWGIDSERRSWAEVWKSLRARLDEQGAK